MVVSITGDQALVKKINMSLALETIRVHAPVSRAQVAELTGLNKATVSNLVSDLLEQQLVTEIGPGQSSGGRKPLLLLFNRHAGHSIGIHLDVHSFSIALCDLSGQILFEKLNLRLLHSDPVQVTEQLSSVIQELIDLAPASPYGVIGIGVGAPGMVDEQGCVLFAPNLGWEQIPLRQWLQDRFTHIPVLVDNEANAGAIGEYEYGAGKHVQHLIYVSAGAGIGTGIMTRGEIFRGAMGYSGELGHMTIDVHGRKCSCGNRGCWELYASEKAILDPQKSLPFHTLYEAIQAAERDDADALHFLYQLGEYLGIGIANLVNGFNPDLIIIGNQFAHLERWIKAAVLRSVKQRALQSHQQNLNIVYAPLQQRSTLLGAANQAIRSFVGRAKVTV
ncbi:xylose repressor, XylR [Paenibacillus aquistagni]|uniref:Xylose repressor, XylR n=1 Tax=Paenibacillus aquistagni TaxID=1852522 RepID=A0A1X7LTH2_9BACL|nr:xylose repressor, XylR [Paenibacillus aquistagni]